MILNKAFLIQASKKANLINMAIFLRVRNRTSKNIGESGKNKHTIQYSGPMSPLFRGKCLMKTTISH